MWEITKEFGCDYGHRVWTQKLNNPEYSIDTACVCRHQHGHRMKVLVTLSGDELNDQGMIADFKELNWFKKFLDDVLDHKMILDINDPSITHFYPLLQDKWEEKIPVHGTHYSIVNPDIYDNQPLYIKEVYEGLVFVNFPPTSEHLSKWLFSICRMKMSHIGVDVSKVQFFETPKSQSIYKI